MLGFIPSLIYFLAITSAATAALPEYGSTLDGKSVDSQAARNRPAGKGPTDVEGCQLPPSSGNNTKHAILDERAMPVHCADVNVASYATKGGILNGLMWASEQAAEQQYQRIYGKQGLDNAYYTHSEMTKYWSRHFAGAYAKSPRDAMQDPGFQHFYQQICPDPCNRPDHHVYMSYENNKPTQATAFGARYNFILNAPANIIIVQNALSPTARFEQLRASGLLLPGAHLFHPDHLSDILFFEEQKQRTRYAWNQRWTEAAPFDTWTHNLRNLNTVIFMGHAGLSQETLSVVKQCLVLRAGTQGLPHWPGLVLKAGDHCFAAILGTDPNKAAAWLLASHKSPQGGYGAKMLSELHIFTTQQGPSINQYPTFLWRVVDWTPQREQEARALEADVHTPPGQPHVS
ncbi:hypothetical protein LTR78_001654 [Recurvomyces mirabilis]|uniref:Uncharacterized protein n=1 Tax=Recurvomyces mirabilis TaxID=574656 RepID=A0AAE0WUG3_9PEZI|nr:hypothetical protein LTR78_001654 [Recurvomyces mirabilis]KAK5151776.1 hypothetical protein LTS14_008908 [Recurvomyces mirabilis]